MKIRLYIKTKQASSQEGKDGSTDSNQKYNIPYKTI